MVSSVKYIKWYNVHNTCCVTISMNEGERDTYRVPGLWKHHISLFLCFILFLKMKWKGFGWIPRCSALIWSKPMSLKAERALVCTPEQISWLWSPVFLDFLQLYKPNSTSDSSAFGITKTTGYLYYSMWHCGFTREKWIFCWNRPINPPPGWSYLQFPNTS